jgi:hypothetical protein
MYHFFWSSIMEELTLIERLVDPSLLQAMTLMLPLMNLVCSFKNLLSVTNYYN